MKHIKTYQLFEGMFHEDRALKPYEKIMANAVVEFFKKKSNVDGQIIVKHKPSDKYIGDIRLNDTTVNKNKFIVFFDKEQGTRMAIKALFHELTHVKQVNKKELLPNDDYTAIDWNGKEFITVKDYNKVLKKAQHDPKEYNSLPWEKEAIDSSDDLLNDFIGSPEWTAMKGKDKTLDAIIDNI